MGYLFICHSDWLLHEESCPRLDLVHPGGALPLLVYTPNRQLESVAIAAQMARTDAALLGALANGGCVVSHNSVYLFLPSFKLIIASLVVRRGALCTDGAVEPCCKLMCPRSPSQLPPSWWNYIHTHARLRPSCWRICRVKPCSQLANWTDLHQVDPVTRRVIGLARQRREVDWLRGCSSRAAVVAVQFSSVHVLWTWL